MKKLIERFAGMVAKMLDVLEVDEGTTDPTFAQGDEPVELEPKTEAHHHTLIETCW